MTSKNSSPVSAVKRALIAQKLRAETPEAGRLNFEPIAITGMGCRFPGAADPGSFWRFMEAGRDAITEVPSDRWDIEKLYSPDRDAKGKTTSKWGSFLNEVYAFDAAFFGITPREALYMDPQHRVLLEVSWEALEDAGQTFESLAGSRTGVYVAVYNNDYAWHQASHPDSIDAYTSSGTCHSIAANRLSYLFDLRGPSMAVDTACSSSLVAVHLACRDLRNEDCDQAIVGAVSLILSHEMTLSLSKWGFLAPDGRCKTFDARADGFVRGEGCGVVILKRLSDALSDGDPVLGVVRGSAVNQDGCTNGLTAPNGLSQQDVIRQALANAGLTPDRVSYIEAHGTGTELGDPIEVEALSAVIGAPRSDGRTCALASVKTNIGHLEAAAGMAGLIKTVLALERETIPPHLHFTALNPKIRLSGTPFVIPTKPEPWPRGDELRFAGVSSFGFGGTNAHVVLEEAPPRLAEDDRSRDTHAHLLALSARSPGALESLAGRYVEFLRSEKKEAAVSLPDLCYTAGVRRSHHEHRVAVVARSREEMAQRVETYLAGAISRGVSRGRSQVDGQAGVVFVFSGQGPQWWGMGRELWEREPVFRECLLECDELVRSHAEWSLLEEMRAGESESRMGQTEIAQPAIFALQLALAALWRSWGIRPAAVVGHSVGEVAASRVAGAISLDDAIRIVIHRGRLMQRATGRGKMVAVELPPEELQPLVQEHGEKLSVAAINGPSSTVLTGEPEAVAEVARYCEPRRIFCRVLPVDYAFHSPQMDPFQEELERSLTGLRPQSSSIPVFSTVSGDAMDGLGFDAAYWARNVREPVRFGDAIERLVGNGHRNFLEIGPHPVLSGFISRLSDRAEAVSAGGSLHRGRSESVSMLEALARLYTLGVCNDFTGLYRSGGRCVRLPAYPWQRRHYRLESFRSDMEPRRQDGRFRTKWEEKELQPLHQEAGTGRWLILADRGGVGAALAERLESSGGDCTLVRAEDVRRSGGGARRLGELVERSGAPHRGIVHLWSLDAASPDEIDASSLESEQALICGSAVDLIQALGPTGAEGHRLWLVTRGAMAVSSQTRPPAVNQAPLWGLATVIALEHPELRPVMVDLDEPATPRDVDQLWTEIRASSSEDRIVFRDGKRLVARLVPLASTLREGVPPFVIPSHGTYLITGGLGGLGLTVAGWLVDKGAKHLVLMGRRGASATAQEHIRALERMGTRVVVAKADVARREELAAVFSEIDTSMPPLRGVVHAAGVIEDGVLVRSTWEQFARVEAPKVQGAWNLHAETMDRPLDFFVLFSSLASVLGSAGQGAYAAANAFIDGLAQYRKRRGLPALSVNWGPWGEAGMSARLDAGARERWRQRGVGVIETKEALEIFESLMIEPHAQVGVFPIDWQRFARQFTGGAPPFLSRLCGPGESTEQPGAASDDGSDLLHRLAEASAGRRRALVRSHVREQILHVLGMPPDFPLDPERGLKEAGMDSLMAVELRNKLQRSIGRALPATLAFDHPTPESLAEHLLNMLFTEDRPVSSDGGSASPQAQDIESVESLTESQAEAVLLQELETMNGSRKNLS